MALVRWRRRNDLDPFNDLIDLQSNINRLFNMSLGGRGAAQPVAWTPNVDIYKEDDSFVMKTELPGLQKEDIDVSVQDNVVTLKGEKKYEKEIDEENYYHSERSFGSFQRSFELPAPVEREKVKASFKDGVLEVKLPLAEEAKPKQIQVNID